MKIPRSRTVLDGMTSCGPILNADRGSWWAASKYRPIKNQNTIQLSLQLRRSVQSFAHKAHAMTAGATVRNQAICVYLRQWQKCQTMSIPQNKRNSSSDLYRDAFPRPCTFRHARRLRQVIETPADLRCVTEHLEDCCNGGGLEVSHHDRDRRIWNDLRTE